MIVFPKVFWDFQKWTFIFVHFLLSEKGFGAKNRIFAMLVGTFVPQPQNIIFSLMYLKKIQGHYRLRVPLRCVDLLLLLGVRRRVSFLLLLLLLA
jgi:hypothetical protein